MRRLAAAAIVMLAACAPAAAQPYVVIPGHMNLEIGPDGNTVVFDAPEGLVVIDSGRHAAHAQAIVAHAQAAGKPVVALANTHWHLDHSTGNRDLLARWPQARLVATDAVAGALDTFLARSMANARTRLADPDLPADARARTERGLAAMADRAALVPAEPVRADGPAMLGGRRFDLHVAPLAATEADLWLVAPDEGVAVVGDLVVAPVPYFDTACADGWRAALDAIGAAEWTTLVPGHGAAMDRAAFDRWHHAFTRWLDCAEGEGEAAACAEGWMADAAGFYTPGEREDVRFLAEAYVAEVIRKPEAWQPYCPRVRTH